MRPTALRKPLASALVVATMTSLAVTAGFVGTATPAAADTANTIFTNTVNAAGPNYVNQYIQVTATGPVQLNLNWDNPAANLTLFLYDPSNALAASVTTSAKPKTISYNAPVTGQYRIGVKAVTNSANYTLSATYPVFPQGVVNGSVWDDASGDGIRQPGETAGIVAATVQLRDSANTVVQTATTAANGRYSFTAVAVGNYTVQFTLPPNYTFSPPGQGSDPTIDSDADATTGLTASFPVTSGSTTVRDAGVATKPNTQTTVFTNSVSASGTNWIDNRFTNSAGGVLQIQLDWDTTAANLNLFLFNPSNGQVASVTSSAKPKSINYATSALGQWRVGVKAVTGSATYTLSVTYPVAPATISGRAWLDTDNDGVQDAGETTGAAGTGVALLRASDSAVLRSVAVDATGTYSFTRLDPGSYVVAVAAQSGWRLSPLHAAGSTPSTDSDVDPATARSATIVLAAGASAVVDAGTSPIPGTVSGRVWDDVDGDGIQDPAETNGLPGATVALQSGGSTVQSFVTTATGTYSFSGIDPGSYTIAVTLPALTTFSPQGQGGNPALDSDVNPTTGVSNAFNVAANGTVAVDAGTQATPATVQGTVWDDVNRNGIRDAGETAGIGGATVELHRASDDGLVASTTAATDGTWQLTGVRPGGYQILVAPGPGLSFSAQGQGSDPTADSDVDPVTGRSALLTIGSGTTTVVDAGATASPATIQGVLWNDVSNDGIRDPSETGTVSSASVRVVRVSDGAVIASASFDVTGQYTFSGLPPDTYRIETALPSGWVLSAYRAGSDPTIDNDIDPATGRSADVVAAAGSVTTVDAGVHALPATIQGVVWNDVDMDGVQSAGETAGIANAVVTLYTEPADDALQQVTVDGTGAYSFGNLQPGSYAVRVVLPAPFVFTNQGQGGNPNVDSDVDLTGRSADLDILPATTTTVAAGAFLQPGTVRGVAWDDANRDGIRQAGEQGGIANAAVQLLSSPGGSVVRTTTSGTDGRYQLGNVAPATYVVAVTPPSTYTLGPLAQGSDPTIDSDIDPATGRSAPFTLAPAGAITRDASILAPLGGAPIVINGSVANPSPRFANNYFNVATAGPIDVNLDWTTTSAVLKVWLYDPTGAVVAQDTTNTKPKVLRFNATTTGRWNVGVQAYTGSSSYTLNINVPTAPTATVNGTVWDDANGDGVRQVGETAGIAGVVVALQQGSTTVATTTTGAPGGYTFTGLAGGSYSIALTLPPGYGLSAKAVGSDPTVDSDVDPATLRSNTIAVARNAAGVIDAGVGLKPTFFSRSFSGTLASAGPNWQTQTFNVTAVGPITATLDWTQTSANFTYFLYDPAGTIVASNTTNQKPKTITFNATVLGNWKIGVKALTGPSSAYSAVVTYPISGQAMVGDYVWYDKNRNGIQDAGETGVAGITVELHRAADDSIVATTVTDANGRFSFQNLVAGVPEYLRFVVGYGYGFTAPAQGSDINIDSDVDPNTGRTAPFTLQAGVPNDDHDAGLSQVPNVLTQTLGPAPNDFQQRSIPVWSAGTIDITLAWPANATDLNLFLYNPANQLVAYQTGNGFPERIVYNATTTGVYRVTAKYISGPSTTFTLTTAIPLGMPVASKASQFGYNGHAGLYGYGVDYNPVTNELIVADVWNHRLLRYDAATGASLGTFAVTPPGLSVANGQGPITPFDVEVASDGSVWVADQGFYRVIVYNPDGSWRQTLGFTGGPQPWQVYPQQCGNGGMVQPTHIAEQPGTGNMYVSDVVCGTIAVYAPDGRFVRSWQVSVPGQIPPSLQAIPRGLDFDSQGNLYVVEFRTKSILVYDGLGTLVRQFPPDPNFRDGRGLVVDKVRNLVYAVDAGDEDVEEWRTDGTYVRTWNSWGGTQLNTPRFVAVDGSGNVYVTDLYGYRVYAWDASGNPLWMTPSLTPPNGGMNNANAISIDPISGKLLVVDTFENRVQVFNRLDAGGNLSSCTSAAACPAFDFAFGNRGFTGNPTAGGLTYPREAVSDGYSIWVDVGRAIGQYTLGGQLITTWNQTGGSLPGQFSNNVTGLVAQPTPGTNGTQGKLYVVDQGNCRIQIFDYQSNLLDYMGGCGSGPNQMSNPRELAVDFTTNRAYVADFYNNRVAVWDLTTKRIVASLAGPFAGLGLVQPVGVALDPTGSWVYIADTNRQRIVRVRPDGTSPELVSVGEDLPAGGFGQPEYLTFDAQGRLYVEDADRVWAFTINR